MKARQTTAYIPHVGESRQNVPFWVGGVGSAKSEDTSEDQQGTEDEKRHAPKAHFFDPSAQAAINKEKVDDNAGKQTQDRKRKSVREEGAIGRNANEGGKVRGVRGGVSAEIQLARKKFPSVA